MDILQYINKMNRLYGNDPAPVRYNTQQYLQGGRVGMKPGGLVEPGVTHYATLTDSEKEVLIQKRFPNKKLNFKKYKFGLPKSDPDYETARYVGKRFKDRKKRTLRESKDPLLKEEKRLKAKEYYSTEKEDILERARKKYEVDDEFRKKVALQNKKTQAKLVLDRGLFPPGQNPKNNVWHDLYRSSQAKGGGNRFILDKKFIDNVPRKEDGTPRWAKDNYYKKIKFKDTKTGKIITYDGMEKYLDETFGKETYKKALDGYKVKTDLRDTRIKVRGKEQKLGTVLRDAVRARGNLNVNSALEVHHPFGIKQNWWNNQVVFRDANRKLNLINNKLTRAAANVKDDVSRKKLFTKFGKEVDKLPGGISLFFEGQQVGTKVPTSESVLRGAAQTVKDSALTRALNKNMMDKKGVLEKGFSKFAKKMPKTAGALGKTGRFLFHPVEMGALPLAIAAEGLYANYANKRDLKKALDQIPNSKLPQYKKNLLLEGYRQEARDVGDIGLETYAIDKPNVSGALKKIGLGDKKQMMDLSEGLISGVREEDAAEKIAKEQRIKEAMEKQIGRRNITKGYYDNYLPGIDDDK